MHMTIDKRILAQRTGSLKLPSVAPMLPPMMTKIASQCHPAGMLRPELASPASPETELTKMNTAETAEAVLVLAQPIHNKSGER